MPLSPEEVLELKAQLKQQVEHLPPDQRKETEAHIDAMSPQAIETMLKQQQEQTEGKTIFRMIVDKEVDSSVVMDNPDALAVLDINPISRGHTLIIPKKATFNEKDLAPGVRALAESVSKKIAKYLKPKAVDIFPDKKFGEVIMHVIPSYDNPLSLSSPRTKSSPEELKKIVSEINVIEMPKPEVIKQTPALQNQAIRLQRRIP